jgi:hypothetical protein
MRPFSYAFFLSKSVTDKSPTMKIILKQDMQSGPMTTLKDEVKK